MIPVAAGFIYGVGVGLPLAIKLLLNFYGSGESQGAVSVITSIGCYGYSFTPFLISSIICGLLPFEWLQWILILASGAVSIAFLGTTYWVDFKENLEPKLRWIAVGLVCAVQLTLILMFKFYFFAHAHS